MLVYFAKLMANLMVPVNKLVQFWTTYSDVFLGCIAPPPLPPLQQRHNTFRINDLGHSTGERT